MNMNAARQIPFLKNDLNFVYLKFLKIAYLYITLSNVPEGAALLTGKFDDVLLLLIAQYFSIFIGC
jgi:hypothetical protein